MAKIVLKGFEDYIRKLDNLESYVDEYVGRAIYGGARIMANAVKHNLYSLPVDNRKKTTTRTSINYIQKMGLIESFGIAPLRQDGDFLNVKLGFDGYNDFITYNFPTGQPNVMIARSLESGTSFMPKNPIISKTIKQFRNACIEEMQNELNKHYERVMR